MNRALSPCRRSNIRGFTLLELMVALLIGLFLAAGMVSVLQGTSHTSNNQMALARLQNNERIAMTLVADVIQQAGYYPDVQSSSLQSAFPTAPAAPGAPAPAFTEPGQVIVGKTGATAFGDSITVRYRTDGTVLNCLGSSDSPSMPHEYTFSVNTSGQLVCAVDGNLPVPLVGNVKNIQVLYGVDAISTTAYSSSPMNAYVEASDMTSANWTNVHSVKIVFTFVNPLAGQPGQGAVPTISFTRVIGVMARNGVDVVTETT
jgi:type IV pilus assembly protein PilW